MAFVTGERSAAARKALRLLAVALAAASLAACAQPAVTADKPAPEIPEAAPEPERKRPPAARQRQAAAKERAPSGAGKPAHRKADSSYGLASFYGHGHGSRTASGERFDARAMTAAHRTLPFGTKVRVTDVASGRSVTVRINDRGPFVSGRIVDISQSAAEELGLVRRGVAMVKLDVVE
jgi:peptidoglycan lytic transglycosylase